MVTVTVASQGLDEGTSFLGDIYQLLFNSSATFTRNAPEIAVVSQTGPKLFADFDGSNLDMNSGVVTSITVGRGQQDFEISGLSLNADAVYNAIAETDFQQQFSDFSALFQGIGWNVDLSKSKVSDVVYGSQGDDTFTLGSGNDTVMLDGGTDVDNAGAGNDAIVALNPLFRVVDGQTSVTGGDGSDTLLLDFRDGDTTLDLFDKGQKVDLETGKYIEKFSFATLTVTFSSIENVSGSEHSDKLLGTNGNNKLVGWEANDELVGRGGGDTLEGDSGSDKLVGGAGADKLTGGDQRDMFVYTKASDSSSKAFDTITDFVHNEDRLDFSALKLAGGAAFRLIGDHAFGHHIGEIQVIEHDAKGTAHDYTMLGVDLDGGGKADLEIELTGLVTLSKHDFAF